MPTVDYNGKVREMTNEEINELNLSNSEYPEYNSESRLDILERQNLELADALASLFELVGDL